MFFQIQGMTVELSALLNGALLGLLIAIGDQVSVALRMRYHKYVGLLGWILSVLMPLALAALYQPVMLISALPLSILLSGACYGSYQKLFKIYSRGKDLPPYL